MELVTIRNNSAIAQSVVFQGRQVTLAPYAEEAMDAVLAGAFMTRCAPVVEEVSVEKDDVYDPDSDDNIWIANVTGHPAYPKEVETKSLQNKKWLYTKTVNPASRLYPVSRDYDPGQAPYTGRDGAWMSLNLPKETITIPPFQRKAMKPDRGNWYLRRENASCRLSGFSPAVIKSRKETSYEPKMDWDLNEMRAYLQIISAGSAMLGPTEAELAASVKAKALSREKAKEVLDDAKRTVVSDSYYYVVDPKYRLPTRAEVRELLTGKSDSKIADEQLDRIVGASA